MKLFRYLVFSLIYIVSISFINYEEKNQNNQNIVVRFGNDYIISFTDLKKYVFDHLFNKRYPDQSEAFNKALDEMVMNQLKRIDFFESGLYKNGELLQSIRRTINEELVIRYFRTQFLGKSVNDESTLEAYKKMGKEVIYRQIVLAKPPNASSDYVDSLKVKVTEIKTKIDNGADFGELIKQYSQHTESAKLGGYMSPINWKQSLSNQIDYIIFNLNVGDTRSLESEKAFHIVKVTNINYVSVRPLDEVKQDIIQTLEERYIEASLKEFDYAKNELIDENTIEWNPKALDQLVAWSNTPDFYEQNYADTLNNAISNGRNFTILKYSKGMVDLKEYKHLLDDILILESSVFLKVDDIKKFIMEAVRTDIIVNMAQELNLEKDIFNPYTTNPVLKDRIAWLYNQRVIESQIPEATDESLKEFYEENKDSLFYQLAKINIYAIIASDKKAINELKFKLDQNVPFEKLTGQVFVKTFILDRDGIIKSYLNEEKPFLGEAAFKLKLTETAGPIEYNDPEMGKQYALIKCVNKIEEKQLLYSDVQKTIIEEFKKYHKAEIEKSVKLQLLSKYKFEIYPDVLKQNLFLMGINAQ